MKKGVCPITVFVTSYKHLCFCQTTFQNRLAKIFHLLPLKVNLTITVIDALPL